MFACVAFPVLLRTLSVHEKQEAFGSSDWRGVLADATVGLGIALLALALSRWSRVAGWVLAVLWVVLNVVNYEYIRVLDAACSFTYIAYLTDPVFFQGSALQLTRPVLLVATIGAVTLAAWRWPRFERRHMGRYAAAAAPVLLAVAALVAWPVRRDQLPWRQDNFVVVNAREALAPWLREHKPMVTDVATLRQLFQPDLSGEPRFASPAKRPNVLVVMVEGLSGAYLPSFARRHQVMTDVRAPGLDALAQKGVGFTSAVAQQRQTNRGEYAVLCGDYPKLLSQEARMTEYARNGTRACLPRLLSEAGYRTAYVQAAPMAFMLKDQFMKRAGFDLILGSDFFESAYAQNRWGVDDKAFFEQSLKVVRDLQRGDQPWFLAMLTVGTHHPFLVPPDFAGSGSPFARAVAYADQAVSAFIDALDREGLLSNTLVVITSDESAGALKGDDVTRSVTQGWIPLIALLPGKPAPTATIHDVYLQSDIGLSVMDYLGLGDRAPHFVGRSLFRKYSQPRPIYFSNTHLKRAFALEPSGLLSMCSEALTDCSSYLVNYERAFSPRRRQLAWRPELLTAWRTVVDHSVRPAEQAPREQVRTRTLPLLTSSEVTIHPSGADQIIAGGQYLTIAKGTEIRVELEAEVSGLERGALMLTHDFYSAAGRHHRPAVPLLQPGDRVHADYAYVFDKDVTHLEAVLLARAVGGVPMTLRVLRGQLTISEAAAGKRPGLHERVFEVERRPMVKPARFSMDLPGQFYRAKCVTDAPRGLQASGCKPGVLLYGPYTWAPAGSRITANVELEVTRGTASAAVELVNGGGRTRLASSERVRVQPGRVAKLAFSYTAPSKLEGLEARLDARPEGSADYVIRSVTLDIQPEARPEG